MAIREIPVPKVKNAFNPRRRPSDLIRQQVEHLRHVAARHPAGAALAADGKRVRTEGQAAAFIGRVMQLLHPEGRGAAPAIAPAQEPASKPGPRARTPNRARAKRRSRR